jgi:hypothetical protein
MAYRLEVKYYNSFWLKQVTTPLLSKGTFKTYGKVFPGLPFRDTLIRKFGKIGYLTPTFFNSFPTWPKPFDDYDPANPAIVPIDSRGYNPYINRSNVNLKNVADYSLNEGSKWVIEESRIRGGFNNNQVDLGVRAYLKEDSNDVRYRPSALVYSGVYNSKTNINNTNVFSVAEDITKSVDPHNGSIQFIYAMDNNLTIFQENKVSQALIDKDAIYSAEGTALSTTSNVVIGQVTPYTGEYGISRNPESFASFGFRRYFADRDRNAILRLSRDGITEISQYGMKDYFRDELSKVSDRKIIRSAAFPLKYENNNIDTGTVPGLGSYVALNIDELNNLGLSINDIVIGSTVELNINFGEPNNEFSDTTRVVTGVGIAGVAGTSPSNLKTLVYISSPLIFQEAANKNPYVRFYFYQKDKIEGGFDNHKDNYIISLQTRSGSKSLDETSDYYSTLTFDESVQGWTTFYTYRPDMIFSMKNNMFTTKYGSLYKHYDIEQDANNFYNVSYPSNITFIFNANPSLSKNFKTVSYEGSDGWQVDSFVSDVTGDILSVASDEIRDTTNPVKSYQEGLYTENGIPYRIGFNRKDNKYVANLINNSPASPGEVNFGNSITGIKGFFSIVTMSTDTTTNKGGTKELFAVSTEFAVSPR